MLINVITTPMICALFYTNEKIDHGLQNVFNKCYIRSKRLCKTVYIIMASPLLLLEEFLMGMKTFKLTAQFAAMEKVPFDPGLNIVGYASVRPFLYFHRFYIFGLLCTSPHRLYLELNFTSTITVLRPVLLDQ